MTPPPIDHSLLNFRIRASGVASSFHSSRRCRTCGGPVGIVTEGQHKFFCDKECRRKRHNKRS